MRKKDRASIRKFLRNERGSTATVFSLSAIPLILLVGAGVDYNLASTSRGNLQEATDAVALATAKAAAAGSSGATLQTFANNYLAATSRASAATLAGYPSINSVTGEVCVQTQMPVDMAVMRVIGVNQVNVTANSCAQVAAGSFEIALVLDTTGSMSSTDNGGQSKLTSLKNAANNFIDTMFDSPTLGPRTKMSVVPFAPSVNVGTSFANASWMDTGGQSSWHWRSPMFAANSAVASNRFALFNILSTQRSSWAWGGMRRIPALPAQHLRRRAKRHKS